MQTIARSHRSFLKSVAVVLLLAAGLTVSASASDPAAAKAKRQTRKVYYVFTTGSRIPVPYSRVAGELVATTASPEQVIRVTDRNRLLGPTFINQGGVFGH